LRSGQRGGGASPSAPLNTPLRTGAHQYGEYTWCRDKKLSYRRRTARCVVSVDSHVQTLSNTANIHGDEKTHRCCLSYSINQSIKTVKFELLVRRVYGGSKTAHQTRDEPTMKNGRKRFCPEISSLRLAIAIQHRLVCANRQTDTGRQLLILRWRSAAPIETFKS